MRQSPFDLAIATMSMVVAATVAGTTTREVFRGPDKSGVEVTAIELGAPSEVSAPRSTFGAGETVVARLQTTGHDDRAWITVRWIHESGAVVDETVSAVAPNGETTLPFRLLSFASRPVGGYRVEVFVDDEPAVARDFEVLPG